MIGRCIAGAVALMATLAAPLAAHAALRALVNEGRLEVTP